MDRYAEARREMVEDLRRRIPDLDEAVLEAMGRVPREVYGDNMDPWSAYGDHPFGIACGQTVSQPYMVALMTSLLAPLRGKTVLEVGTGSGYQAAVLLETGVRLVTVERIFKLHLHAASLLGARYGKQVRCVYGDGQDRDIIGGPFSGIIVTAAAGRVAPAWTAALEPEGRLIVPLGSGPVQRLMRLTEEEGGRTREEEILACRFVPLLSGCSGEGEG